MYFRVGVKNALIPLIQEKNPSSEQATCCLPSMLFDEELQSLVRALNRCIVKLTDIFESAGQGLAHLYFNSQSLFSLLDFSAPFVSLICVL